ncbi:MAG: DNA topoisomerase IV subunit B [Alphaproteobacteria bacterium]
MTDLFDHASKGRDAGYSAKDIEVLEGLEPVRRRPGMYIGGTDERALHHLAAEVLDNAMDEAVAGHASRIDVELDAEGFLAIRDNGRGIPVDPHPKYPGKSALEVILTTLHSGGKFSGKAYETAGGLHGVGISVVNALADRLEVDVARDRKLYRQTYSRGVPQEPLREAGAVANRRGTSVRFHPDPQVFGEGAAFKPARLYRMVRSKAYLFRGVEIRWRCDPGRIPADDPTPPQEILHFPGGLLDFLTATVAARPTITPVPFAGRVVGEDSTGQVEWAVCWPTDEDGFVHSYCNTIPTPQGGSHDLALRSALARGMRAYAEMLGNKRAAQITADDLLGGACIMLSVFIRDPQFQGQTKEKLSSPEAAKLVEGALKDHFELWLSGDPAGAKELIDRTLERAEERKRKRESRDLLRKTPTRRLRLPGKLTDCSDGSANGTEIFLVEGDSAGGSAKQARDRRTQAVLPLRGKILNVASASADKLAQNQELRDLVQALGCGVRGDYDDGKLRYERVVIMTDADVDGAHIASLLMTFFYREMPGLIENGHLYLAMPPLYRLTQGGTTVYARDDAHKDALMAKGFKSKAKIEVSRFKGLGEMPPAQLKTTTMDPATRTLLQVRIPDSGEPGEARRTARLVESLMGRKPELRFQFIQENAASVATDAIDV